MKANGYGLGSCAVATALAQAGCERFFVASLAEAIELRTVFRQTGHGDLPIMVLHGVPTRAGGGFHGPSLGTSFK